jgi:hypothetical protein
MLKFAEEKKKKSKKFICSRLPSPPPISYYIISQHLYAYYAYYDISASWNFLKLALDYKTPQGGGGGRRDS